MVPKALADLIAGIALILMLTTGAPGQTGRSASAGTRPGDASAIFRPRIAVSIPAADHGWTAGVGWWARRAATLYPHCDWTIVTASGPQKQIADIEDLLARGIDALVILAHESGPLTPVAREAKRRGVFIVNVDRGFLQNPDEPPIADIFIEGDNKAFGRASGEFIARRLNGRGNVVILTGVPSTVDTDRVESARAVLLQHPGIRILDVQRGDWQREKALRVMEDMLTKHPKIDAVWAADDDMALGVIQAIRERGREKEMWVLGGGGMKEIVRMVMERDPLVPATITYPPSMIAVGMHLAASVMTAPDRGRVMEFMPRHLLIDVELVTPDNARRHYFPDSVY